MISTSIVKCSVLLCVVLEALAEASVGTSTRMRDLSASMSADDAGYASFGRALLHAGKKEGSNAHHGKAVHLAKGAQARGLKHGQTIRSSDMSSHGKHPRGALHGKADQSSNGPRPAGPHNGHGGPPHDGAVGGPEFGWAEPPHHGPDTWHNASDHHNGPFEPSDRHNPIRACHADFDSFCQLTVKDIHNVEEAILCLSNHTSELSPICHDVVENTTKKIAEFHSACDADASSLCPSIPATSPLLHQCMVKNLPSLSKGCLSWVSDFLSDTGSHPHPHNHGRAKPDGKPHGHHGAKSAPRQPAASAGATSAPPQPAA